VIDLRRLFGEKNDNHPCFNGLNTLCHPKSNGLRDHLDQQSAINAHSLFIFLCGAGAQPGELRRAL
jgi:hypothetical protein